MFDHYHDSTYLERETEKSAKAKEENEDNSSACALDNDSVNCIRVFRLGGSKKSAEESGEFHKQYQSCNNIGLVNPLTGSPSSSVNTSEKTGRKYTSSIYQAQNDETETDDSCLVYSKLTKLSSSTIDQFAADAETFIKKEIKRAFEIEKNANTLFKQSKFSQAKSQYLLALKILQVDTKYNAYLNQNNFLSIKLKCMSDIAICHYKMREFQDSVNMANEILKIRKSNFDAHFIKAKALKYLEKFEEAFDSVKAALSIKSNKTLLKDYKELEERVKLLNSAKKKGGSDSSISTKDSKKSVKDSRPCSNEVYKHNNTDSEMNRDYNENTNDSDLFTVIKGIILALKTFAKKNKVIVFVTMSVLVFYLKKLLSENIGSILSWCIKLFEI